MRNVVLERVVSAIRTFSAAKRQGEKNVFSRRILLVLALVFSLGLVVPQSTSAYASGYPLPNFELPYYTGMGVSWSGGPHQWDKGPDVVFMDLYSGSGIDFAKAGQTFGIAAMAEGDVIYADDDANNGLGLQVAVKHTVGGSVVIYGHLSSIWQPLADTFNSGGNYHVYPGYTIGYAGMTGNAPSVHLHVELRDGSRGCCGDSNDGGNPVSWHSVELNGYRIYNIRPNELGINPNPPPNEVAYNYDGVAVRVSDLPSELGPFEYDHFSFPDYDGTIRQNVFTWLPSDFACDGISNCELNTHPDVVFAGHGRFGGGGVLASDISIPPEQPQPGSSTPTPEPTDTVPPETIHSLTGTEGNNGWHVSPVSGVLNTSDNEGVAHTYYRVNAGSTVEANSFSLSEDGIYEVCYWSADINGNVEAAKCVQISIDQMPPVTTGTATGSRDMLGIFRSPVENALSAEDNLSGVEKTEVSFDNGNSWTLYSGVFTLEANGVYEYLFRSVDVAGNVEVSKNSGTIDIQRFTFLADSLLSAESATTLSVQGVAHTNSDASFIDNTTFYMETLEYLGQFSQSGNVTFTIDNLIQTTEVVRIPLYPLSFYKGICTFVPGPITVSSTSHSYNECWYVDDDVTLRMTGATGNLTIVSEGVIYDRSTNSHLSAWDTTNGVLFWARRGYATVSTGSVYEGVVYSPFSNISGGFTNATLSGGQFANNLSLGSGTTLNAQQAAGFPASEYTLPLVALGVTSPNLIYVSSTTGGTAGTTAFADEDVLAYSREEDSYTLLIDGSDIGLANTDIDAFSALPDGTFLMSFDVSISISGLGTVYDADIVKFTPTSLGSNTAGSFAWYFDASDVGLTTSDEDVDAIGFTPDGKLVVSTLGSFSVNGVSGNDEDLIVFTATQLGATTSGTWAMYFDGSDVSLNESSNEDVNGVWIDEVSGQVFLTTVGTFSVNGVAGDGADIFVCTPGSLGPNTVCTYGPGLYWDGSKNGFAGEVLDSIEIQK